VGQLSHCLIIEGLLESCNTENNRSTSSIIAVLFITGLIYLT